MKQILVLTILFIPFIIFGKEKMPKSIFSFKVNALNGGVIDFSKFKGKKILIVNTTIQDDQNYQYTELDSLYKKYKDNLVVVGFLVPDFSKPPHTKVKNIKETSKHYDVSFPLVVKTNIFGDSCVAIYKWLKQKKYNKLKDNEISWDFQKYLLNEKGKLIAIYKPTKSVFDTEVIEAIEDKLNKSTK